MWLLAAWIWSYMCACESVVLSSVLLLFKRGVLIACQIVFMTLLHNATDSFIYLLCSTELSSKWAIWGNGYKMGNKQIRIKLQ